MKLFIGLGILLVLGGEPGGNVDCVPTRFFLLVCGFFLLVCGLQVMSLSVFENERVILYWSGEIAMTSLGWCTFFKK